MADTDQQPTQGTKKMGREIDWRALAQYGGTMLAGLSLTVGAWAHGMLLGYGERLTKLETKNEAAALTREAEMKQREKDAASLVESIKEMRTNQESRMQSIDAQVRQVASGVTSLQLDLVRATAGRSGNGGMP